MLADPVTFWDRAVEAGMDDEWFWVPSHRVLWGVVSRRVAAGEPVDLVSVCQELQDRGELEKVGGTSSVADIYAYSTTSAYWDEHVRILRGKVLLRRLMKAAQESLIDIEESEDEAEVVLDRAEAAVMSARSLMERPQRRTLVEVAADVLTRLEASLACGGGLTGLTTGFDGLDQLTGGLHGGELVIVAARPSMGKTAFLLTLIEHVAIDEGKKVALFSCEMPDVQIVERLILSRARVDRTELASRGLLQGTAARLHRSIADLQKAALVIDDTAGIAIGDLRARARRIKRELGGLDLIGVDYLQLVRSLSRQALSSREREVAEISSGLKALAKELDVPVVALAQLNRGPESRAGKVRGLPQMSDLRESGTIEQDADLIGLLYRSAYYAEDEKERQEVGNEAHLYLAKNRNGATGDVPLEFEARYMRFVDASAQKNGPQA